MIQWKVFIFSIPADPASGFSEKASAGDATDGQSDEDPATAKASLTVFLERDIKTMAILIG